MRPPANRERGVNRLAHAPYLGEELASPLPSPGEVLLLDSYGNTCCRSLAGSIVRVPSKEDLRRLPTLVDNNVNTLPALNVLIEVQVGFDHFMSWLSGAIQFD